uniref:FA_desaturase domain-containing protein n=1 Tax=Panagrellus redivivus TaxID=6233 RepID=A0A7E5A188_PANRE
MSTTTAAPENVRLKVNGKWLDLGQEFVINHPGGSVLTQYQNADATHIFHAFHEGSAMAYKQLSLLEKTKAVEVDSENDPTLQYSVNPKETNVYSYDITIEKEKNIVLSFEKLRQRVHSEGLMDIRPYYFAKKCTEVIGLMFFGFYLQYLGHYLTSALFVALSWQQLGWLTHEFCHHQPFKNRKANDAMSLFFGNFAQGFSRDWWKDKHNTHHAATNVIDQDGDIDLAPFLALVPDDLKKYREPVEQFVLKIVPYQHLYYTAMLPLLRFSWCSQSIVHCFTANGSIYKKDREHALPEQVTLALHWTWVLLQLYLLPSNFVRLLYFVISQGLGGLLIAGVVTYNHNSVDKFPENSRALNNFAALNIMGTRNMQPSPFVDWLWGGLNYQIEHHLFPTMPRPNLTRCSELVKQFCKENDLPYLVDDYWTGYEENLRQLENMAKVVHAKLNN